MRRMGLIASRLITVAPNRRTLRMKCRLRSHIAAMTDTLEPFQNPVRGHGAMTVAGTAAAGRNQVPLGIAYMVGSTVMFAGGNAVVKW
jgi:hypothetical protein